MQEVLVEERRKFRITAYGFHRRQIDLREVERLSEVKNLWIP